MTSFWKLPLFYTNPNLIFILPIDRMISPPATFQTRTLQIWQILQPIGKNKPNWLFSKAFLELKTFKINQLITYKVRVKYCKRDSL
jgi:hypothetical protein